MEGRPTRQAVVSGLAASTIAVVVAESDSSAGAINSDQPHQQSDGGIKRWDTAVIGAGVFGTWTAWDLRRKGQRVLLVDAYGPAHARASSGGESRMTRTAYGPDEVYTRMAWESLDQWKWLSSRAGLPIFHRVGVLFFFERAEPYVAQTLEVHKRLNLPIESLSRAELTKRFPQFFWEDIEVGLYESDFGALMARRAVQTLVSEFIKEGGEYQVASVEPLHRPTGPAGRLDSLAVAGGEPIRAERYVFACGPWLPKVFPDVLGSRVFVTRQEVFFFASPPGDSRFFPGRFPGWADFNAGDMYYGFPDLEARGFKVAHDRHGPSMDPDRGDRQASASELADVRAFMKRRLPSVADRPLSGARVCQYENSSNGDLLIDRHPSWNNVWLVGAGSGHGFKHGPAVGRYSAELIMGELKTVQQRFSLATKADVQARSVH
jgi:glycine/D-amino acid oxidase-like deaminating enzyme